MFTLKHSQVVYRGRVMHDRAAELEAVFGDADYEEINARASEFGSLSAPEKEKFAVGHAHALTKALYRHDSLMALSFLGEYLPLEVPYVEFAQNLGPLYHKIIEYCDSEKKLLTPSELDERLLTEFGEYHSEKPFFQQAFAVVNRADYRGLLLHTPLSYASYSDTTQLPSMFLGLQNKYRQFESQDHLEETINTEFTEQGITCGVSIVAPELITFSIFRYLLEQTGSLMTDGMPQADMNPIKIERNL